MGKTVAMGAACRIGVAGLDRNLMTPTRRTVLVGAAATALSTVAPLSAGAAAAGSRERLSNLAHLDFLRTSVAPPPTPGHATYGSGPVGVLWTYADRQADGS